LEQALARPQTISDEEILEVARAQFLEHGPSVSTDLIATELGVSPQALYKRFGNKNGLLLASMVPTAPAPWIPLVESGPDERTFEDQLREILEEIAVYFVEISRRITVIRWSGVEPDELLALFDEPPPIVEIRVLSDWLKRAHEQQSIGKIDFSATAMLILTSLHGPTMLTDLLGQHPTGHTESEYVDVLVKILAHGIAS